MTIGGAFASKGLASVQTAVRIGYDENHLYFAFECMEPSPAKMVVTADKRDDIIKDEHVEVFLQPDSTVNEYDHIGVNPANVQYDQRVTVKGGKVYDWDPAWTSKTRILEDKWVAEIGIPFAAINHAGPQMGQVWRVLLCRDHKAETGEASSWPYVEGVNWHFPSGWGLMKGIILGAEEKGIQIAACDTGDAAVGKNKLALGLNSRVPAAVDLTARTTVTSPDNDVRRSSVKMGRLAGNEAKSFMLPYELVPQEGKHTVEFRIEDSGGKMLCQTPPVPIDIPSFIRGFLDRSYYTREKKANATLFLDKLGESLRKECSLRCRVIADGKQVGEEYAKGPLGTKATLTFDLSMVPVGKHGLEITLENSHGKKLAACSLPLRKHKPLAKGTEAKILVREGGTSVVLLNGKPVFPLGLYLSHGCALAEDIMADAAGAGFNYIQNWSSRGSEKLEAELDMARKVGIHVVGQASRLVVVKRADRISYSMSQARLRKATVKTWFPQLEQKIPQFITHPALMGWRHWDEPPASHIHTAALVGGKIRESDPYHNVAIACCDLGVFDVPNINDAGELWVNNPYLADSHPMASVWHDVHRLKQQCAGSHRVPIICLQVMVSGQLRQMSYEEQRCQSFLSVIAGGKGIEWFPDRSSSLGAWEDHKKVVRQISQIADVLLAPDVAQNFSVEQDPSKPIYARLFREGQDYFLIAANSILRPTSACFKIQGLKENGAVREIYKRKKLRSGPDGLTLDFGPYEVLAYRMRLDR